MCQQSSKDMSEKYNILISSAGSSSAENCIDALLQQDELDLRLVVIDADSLAAGLHRVDTSYVVPSVGDESYWENLIEICKREEINVILPTIYIEIVEYCRQAPKLKELGIKSLLPNAAVASQLASKWKQYELITKLGLLQPNTQHSQNLIDYTPYRFGAILKPEYGSGSRRVLRAGSETEALQFITNAKEPYIIQEIIDAREITVDLVANTESKIVALLGRERLRVKGGMSVATKTVDISHVYQYIELLVSELHIVGPANIQFFYESGRQPMFFDINVRFAAGGLPLSTVLGINMPLITVKLALGMKVNRKIDYPIDMTMLRYYTYIVKKIN